MNPSSLCFDLKQIILHYLTCQDRLVSQRVSKNWHFMMSCHPLPRSRCFSTFLSKLTIYSVDTWGNISCDVHEISNDNLEFFFGNVLPHGIHKVTYHGDTLTESNYILPNYCQSEPYIICYREELILHCYRQKETYTFSLDGILKHTLNDSILEHGEGPFCADLNYLFAKKKSMLLIQFKIDSNKKWKFPLFSEEKNLHISFSINEKHQEIFLMDEKFIYIFSYTNTPNIVFQKRFDKMIGTHWDLVYCDIGVIAVLIGTYNEHISDAIVLYSRNGQLLGYVYKTTQVIENMFWSGTHLYAKTQKHLLQFSLLEHKSLI